MDEEELETTGKRITINNFFESIEDIDRLSTNAIQKVTDQQATIEGLAESISEIKLEIAEIQEFIKFQKDLDEDRRLEEEDARQKQEMTERALALQGVEDGQDNQSPEDQGVSFDENARQKNLINPENKKGFFGSLLGLFGSSLLQLPAAALGLNKFNKGGKVEDNDNITSNNNEDSVLAALTPGEFVVTKDAVKKVGVDTLKGINAAAGGTNEPKLLEGTLGKGPAGKLGVMSKEFLGFGEEGDIKTAERSMRRDEEGHVEKTYFDGSTDIYEQTADDGSSYFYDKSEMIGSSLKEESISRYNNEETFEDGTKETFIRESILKSEMVDIAVVDAITHKDQLMSEVNKLEGFEKVTFKQILNNTHGIPNELLFPILAKSNASKATAKKKRKAQKLDREQGIQPSSAYRNPTTFGYRINQINPPSIFRSQESLDEKSRLDFKYDSKNDPTLAKGKKEVKGFSEGGLVGEDIESGANPFAGILPPFVDKFKNFAEGLEKSPLGESLKDEKIPKSLESIATDIGTKIDPKDVKDVVIQTVVKKLFGDIEPSAFSPVSDEDIKKEKQLESDGKTFELSGASKKLIGGDEDFLEAVKEVSEKRGINQSEFLGLMASESSLDPKAVNKDTGATGLIQFLPEVAESLGTTTDKISEMSRAEQVKLIDKYFDMNKLPDNPTAGQLKTNVLMPAYTDKDDDFELMTKFKKFTDGEAGNPNTFSQNKGLDYNEDGFVTVGEAGESIMKKMKEFGIKDITPQKGEVTPILENKLEDLTNNILSNPAINISQNTVSPQEIVDQNAPTIVQADAPQVTDVEIKPTKTFIPFMQLIQNEQMQINIDESMKELAKIIT